MSETAKNVDWLKSQSIKSVRDYNGKLYVTLDGNDSFCNCSTYSVDKKTKEVEAINPLDYKFGRGGSGGIVKKAALVNIDGLLKL